MFLAAVLCKTAAMCYDTKRQWWKMNDKAAKRSGAAMISVIVLSVLLLGVSFILGRGGSSSVSDLYAANLPVRLAYLTIAC